MDEMDLATVAKVDLHRHLEGAIRLGTVFELSREAGIELPADTPEALARHALVTEPIGSLEEALLAFAITQNAIRTLDGVRRIAREAVEDLDADGVRLGELRFSPEFLCEPGALDWDAALEAIEQGVAEALAGGADVAVGLIAIFSRDYGLESCERTVAWAIRHADRLVGFDIAGPEVPFPPNTYAEAIRPIRDTSLGLTVHYGESGPPAYPRDAVLMLEPSRLGHGLAVAWDRDVQALIEERGVTLEMCPTSNWLTKGVPTVASHPILRLLRDGVRATLNTDDPGLMGIDLVHEWRAARDEIGFEPADFRAATANAIEASFLPERVTDEVRARHFGWLEEPAGAAPAGVTPGS
jgi:adenosine deaminase